MAVALPEQCTNNCNVPYGAELGKNRNTIGYSNCNTECISNQPSQAITNRYTGMSWQCVEYARRWLINVKQVTFDDVDNAQQIWLIKNVTEVDSHKKYHFLNIPNNNNHPPAVGDLIIYKITQPYFPYGHVGVVVGTNLKAGFVDIAEQNYTNDQWVNVNQFARRIILSNKYGKYQLIDKDYDDSAHLSIDGVIIGWKHVLKNSL
jgi:hypothetical protein